jgi:hypothetical protein
VAVGPEAEVDDVEVAELTDPQLVGLGPLVAAHRVDGVGRADPLEQRLPAQSLVGVGGVGRHAALVAPVHVDLPPVDLLGADLGQALVAPARGGAPGEGQREVLAGAGVERFDDTLGELAGDVVDDEELSVLAAASPALGPFTARTLWADRAPISRADSSA